MLATQTDFFITNQKIPLKPLFLKIPMKPSYLNTYIPIGINNYIPVERLTFQKVKLFYLLLENISTGFPSQGQPLNCQAGPITNTATTLSQSPSVNFWGLSITL